MGDAQQKLFTKEKLELLQDFLLLPSKSVVGREEFTPGWAHAELMGSENNEKEKLCVSSTVP